MYATYQFSLRVAYCHGREIALNSNQSGQRAHLVSIREAGPGMSAKARLRQLQVRPIPHGLARAVLLSHHYTRSMPGGTKLTLGVFIGSKLSGAMTFGVGPMNGHMLVDGASRVDCLTLTRLCMWGDLPPNAASRALGMVSRSLRAHTDLRFLITYADPAQGHTGVIYQASNWAYTGLSEPTPLYDLGDGVLRHSRTVGHIYGTHSIRLLRQRGIKVKLLPQPPKHRYIYFLDRRWRKRLRGPEMPYPKPSTHQEQS